MPSVPIGVFVISVFSYYFTFHLIVLNFNKSVFNFSHRIQQMCYNTIYTKQQFQNDTVQMCFQSKK